MSNNTIAINYSDERLRVLVEMFADTNGDVMEMSR